jgi:hypothetical protein
MDSRTPGDRVQPDAADTPEAAEFVRFCYRRRRVGWPDLYDEMCAVASRRQFRGWDVGELAEHGVGFSLFAMPALARLVGRVIDEEQANAPRRAGFSIGRLASRGQATDASAATTPEPVETAPVALAQTPDASPEPDHREVQRDRVPALVPLVAR